MIIYLSAYSSPKTFLSVLYSPKKSISFTFPAMGSVPVCRPLVRQAMA